MKLGLATTNKIPHSVTRCWRLAAVTVFFTASVVGSARGDYTVERVVNGLNQPIYMTQAPGDGASLYVVEREDTGDQLGRIRKYDLMTRSISTFLEFTGTAGPGDGGLLSMAFHPEFQSNGLFYAVSNANGTNRLEEYKVISGTPTFQRRLMQYQNLDNIFHTMNQAHFRPNGNNNELFLTTGDGGTQANSANFNKALIQSPTSPYGKLMKVDLTQPFATPASAPGPGTGVSVVALGIRNPYRSSFDRQTGDFYFGDVGFETAEEIDFIPASHFTNPSPPVLDFGWADREGTVATVPSPPGGPGSAGDINPILDYPHGGNPLPHPPQLTGQSVTAGYVYRGTVPEFQNRYFLADFVNGNVYSGTFNPATNPATFNGTNMTGIQNHTADFETRIGGGANIQFVTSFGEDNVGNLYVVKFGNGFFPPLGEGEIFRISPVTANTITVNINRTSGAITLTNTTGADIAFSSLAITSAVGAIDADELTPITGNYDSPNGGEIDSNDPWTITSPAGSHTLFHESTTGDAGVISGEPITLSPDDGWIPSPTEDLSARLLLDNGTVLNATVTYTGNGGNPFSRSDLDFNGDIEVADWSVFLANTFANLSGLSRAESYGRGDLDGDGDNDFADYRLFKTDFNVANGAGAFEAMIEGVPEPGGMLLALCGAATLLAGRRTRRLP